MVLDAGQSLDHKLQAPGIGRGNDQLRAAWQLHADAARGKHPHRPEGVRRLNRGLLDNRQWGKAFSPKIERLGREALLAAEFVDRVPGLLKPYQPLLPLLGFAVRHP